MQCASAFRIVVAIHSPLNPAHAHQSFLFSRDLLVVGGLQKVAGESLNSVSIFSTVNSIPVSTGLKRQAGEGKVLASTVFSPFQKHYHVTRRIIQLLSKNGAKWNVSSNKEIRSKERETETERQRYY